MLFVIPVVINLHEHRFEVYTLVSEIHDNVDMVMVIKYMYEIVGVIYTYESCTHFLNRFIVFFPQSEILLKPREQKFIEIDEISGLTLFKLLDLKTGCTNTIKVKFIRNLGFLDVTNNSSALLIFTKDETLGILDLRSIGYYKVKQSIIQHHSKPYYKFILLQVLHEEFNMLNNALKKEEQQSTDPYPR